MSCLKCNQPREEIEPDMEDGREKPASRRLQMMLRKASRPFTDSDIGPNGKKAAEVFKSEECSHAWDLWQQRGWLERVREEHLETCDELAKEELLKLYAEHFQTYQIQVFECGCKEERYY